MLNQQFLKSVRRISLAAGLLACTAAPAWADKFASYVIDLDSDRVLHSRNADDARYPASLTKVMTLYMVFDALKAGELMLSDKLTVTSYAASQPPSKLALKPGSTISVEDAINALVTKSANDVAVVIAERLGGSESRFAALMTAKARQLGLKNTRFKNASGLHDPRQSSTAHDLALLGEAIMVNHAEYYDYFSTRQFDWADRSYKNHNKLLGEVRGVDGIKTGYTRASGFNLLASAERDGHRVIAVMMGGSSSRSRNEHVENLLEAAFETLDAEAADSKPTLRARIAFGDIEAPTTADLNAAQLDDLDEDTAEIIDQGSGPE
ncbi:MAG: penicillin-binding protein [Hirschia sp.]|nr:penicillin-binding protein [Hirschia sp.]MBF17172.1 penicillin-binding protein [Hirschia sp.]|tara:strand:- start:1299 stop:2264 length:966 start_codon:yes stop_codon:yes gene_type:complete